MRRFVRSCRLIASPVWLLPVGLLSVWLTVEAGPPLIRVQGETMGTYYTVTIDAAHDAAPDATEPARITEELERVLREFSRQMSTWDPESEISRFNRSGSVEWFPVSADFATVVTEAARVHELSGGLFDPTLAPLIDLWGFGTKKHRNLPPDAAIRVALERVGMPRIEVRSDPPAIRTTLAGVQINLSAIAPGFAIDRIAATVERLGFPSYLVDIGGECRAGRARSGGRVWRIGVESPLGGLHKVVELAGKSVATSGDYRNFFERDGRRFSHVLNPVTGRPVENPPASVSVLSDSSMTADALATALMVMRTEAGLRFAEMHGLDVMFLDVDPDGQVVESSRGVFANVAAVAPAETRRNFLPKPAPLPNTGPSPKPEPSPEQTGQPHSSTPKWWVPTAAIIGITLLAASGMSRRIRLRHSALDQP